jgi:hypothetical protein
MGRRFGTGIFGCISSRIAERMAPIARSCSVIFLSSRVSSCAKRRASSRLELNIYAFTEHGAIMAATILNSPRAVEMSVYVVRAFVQLREGR